VIGADELVTVFISQGHLPAEVIKGKLQVHGIRAMLRYSPLGRALGITIDGLGRVDVLVRREDAAEARQILAETDDPTAQPPGDADTLGETV